MPPASHTHNLISVFFLKKLLSHSRLPQLQARYRKKSSRDSQGAQFSGFCLVYTFFNINIEMEIIKYKKICHLRILLIRYWQFFRPGTLVTPFISFAVFYFSLPIFLFYSTKDKFSGIKCMAVHRIYALFALPHQSLMIPVIMEDYTWWLYWSFSIATANMHFPYFFLFHKEQNKPTPQFYFFLPIFRSHSLFPLYPYYSYQDFHSDFQP